MSAGVVLATMAALSVVGVSATIYAKTRQLGNQMTAASAQRFSAVQPIQDEELEALRTYKNEEHVERAQALGVSEIEERRDADSLAARGVLVPLQSGDHYTVREMDYAVPLVTPSTLSLLDSIGVRFQQELARQGLPPYRFVITSATRTREDQERLQGVNTNAALKSSHEYGTTVDLHYAEFDYAANRDSVPDGFWISDHVLASMMESAYSEATEERDAALKAVLGRVLHEMQQEGKVLVIYERLQPVYHITLGKPLPATRPSVNPVPPAQAIATTPPLSEAAR